MVARNVRNKNDLQGLAAVGFNLVFLRGLRRGQGAPVDPAPARQRRSQPSQRGPSKENPNLDGFGAADDVAAVPDRSLSVALAADAFEAVAGDGFGAALFRS